MEINYPSLEAFLKEEVDWHMQTARLCLTMGATLTSDMRSKDWQSRAHASIRSAEACVEKLRTLRIENAPK